MSGNRTASAAARAMRGAGQGALRILAVDDDPFTRALVSSALEGAGYDTMSVDSVRNAIAATEESDFHALVTDLDLGSGPSGVDLLWRVHEDRPWVGLIVLTSHASPELAVGPGVTMPPGTVYLVKSELEDVQTLSRSIDDAVRGGAVAPVRSSPVARAAVTPAQAEVLRLLSSGMSTSVIARTRATSTRAAEMMVHRLYEKLGLQPNKDRDPRTAAVLMWQQGRVRVQ